MKSDGEPAFAQLLRNVFTRRQWLVRLGPAVLREMRDFVVKRDELGADSWRRLPRARLEWKAIQLSGHFGSPDEVTQTVGNIHRMGFNVILYCAATTRAGFVGFESERFPKDPSFGEFDPLGAVVREARRLGIAVYAGTGLWGEGGVMDGKGNVARCPAPFKAHPEYAHLTGSNRTERSKQNG